LNIANKVAEFQRQDSLKTSAIAQQDIIIKRLEYQSEVDSSIIAAKDMHIEILEERVELLNQNGGRTLKLLILVVWPQYDLHYGQTDK
jgi:hypothetical protein